MLYLLLAALPAPSVQTAIKDAVGSELADPFSAQYEWPAVEDEMVYCGFVNAKNHFGAYTGYQPFLALYAVGKSGKPRVYSVSLKPEVVLKMCPENGYAISR